MAADTRAELERIAHAMLAVAWPGRSGPRNLRILATLVRRQHNMGCSSVVGRVGLRELAIRAGLSDNDKQPKAALKALEAGGWITYKPSERRYVLIVPDTTARYPIKQIPDPMLDCYQNTDGSTSGTKFYLDRAKAYFDGTVEEHNPGQWLSQEGGYFGDGIARERLATFEASVEGYRANVGKGKHPTRGIGDWIIEGAKQDLLDAPVDSRPTPHLCDDCGVLLRYIDGRYAKTCDVCGAQKITIMEMSEVLS